MNNTWSKAIAITATVAMMAGATTHAEATESPMSFTTGHIDLFHPVVTDGALQLKVSEDVTGQKVLREPSNVEIVVSKDAWSQGFNQLSENFIGQPAAVIPQSQNPKVVWVGWDAIALKQANLDSVDFEFQEVTGPGKVYLFETAGLNAQKKLEVSPILANNAFELTTGANIHSGAVHKHLNWAFTQPGQYTFKVQAKAGELHSQVETYKIRVAENPNAQMTNPSTGNQPPSTGNQPQSAPLGIGAIIAIVVAIVGVIGGLLAALKNFMKLPGM